jgi:hypothetical protein
MKTLGTFANPRYATSEIAADLPLDLQILLWGLIDQLEGDKDYLQVFELSLADDGHSQRIIHTQEVPEYQAEYTFPTLAKQQGKVFVIDDGAYSTMLWSSQY